MKTFTRTALLIALFSTMAPSVFAATTGFQVPDGGSTALMLGLVVAGAAAVRRFRR